MAENYIFENAEVFAHSAVERLCAFLEASERSFEVCLSGRSISRRLYECLAASQIVSCLTWSRSHWFWADDRFVRHDDGDSNCRMTRPALLSRILVPDNKIHAVLTEGLSSKHATAAYETTPKRFYGAEVNWIDNTRRLGGHGVIACSALKRRYRDVLLGNREDVRLIYLNGHERLAPSAPIMNISCREACSIGNSKRRKVPGSDETTELQQRRIVARISSALSLFEDTRPEQAHLQLFVSMYTPARRE